MIRNIFCLFLVFLLSIWNVRAYDFKSNGIYYTLKNGVRTPAVEVAVPPSSDEYRGEMVVPASVSYRGNNYKVSAIACRAFSGCASLTSLTVPASVVEIGDSAFFGCTALKYLVLEDGDKPLRVGCNRYQGISAGEAIFHDCPLETLYLGRELQYEGGFFYGYSPFYKKRHLSLVIVGDGVRQLENRAFYGCEDLTSITLGGRVSAIGNYAFYGCKSLRELVIKEGDAPLAIGTNGTGKNLFSDAPLEILYLGRDLKYPESVGHLYNPFFQKASLSMVTVGEAAKAIPASAFQGCSNIVSFTVGSRVEHIGDYAFSGCTSLRELYFKDAEAPLSLGVNRHTTSSKGEALFYDCPVETLYLGRTLDYSTSYFDGYAPFYDRTALHTVVVGETVVSLGDRLFFGCHSLARVTIGGSVEFIGNYVFRECAALTDVVFRDGELPLYVGYNKFSSDGIGESLFSDCRLQTLYLGRTLSYNMSSFYGFSPFYQQTRLSSVTLGDYVFLLPPNLFYGCSALGELSVPGNVSEVGNAALSGCTALKRVEFQDGAEPLSLGYNLFSEAGGKNLFSDTPVETLYLGRSLQYISGAACGWAPFAALPTLVRVDVGPLVRNVPDDLFRNCTRLETVVVGANVETLGNRVFQGCTALLHLVFQDGTRPLEVGYNLYTPSGVGRSLFYDNPLTTLYLGRELRYPDTIYYGYSPFYRKETLSDVTLGPTVTAVGNRLFYGCVRLKDLTIQGTLSRIGTYAFYGCPAHP